LSPAPAYTYRTIGGLLDIHIFMGPTPLETQQQFTEAIGRAPIPP
jgi:lysosomal alpha-glucosidase